MTACIVCGAEGCERAKHEVDDEVEVEERTALLEAARRFSGKLEILDLEADRVAWRLYASRALPRLVTAYGAQSAIDLAIVAADRLLEAERARFGS